MTTTRTAVRACLALIFLSASMVFFGSFPAFSQFEHIDLHNIAAQLTKIAAVEDPQAEDMQFLNEVLSLDGALLYSFSDQGVTRNRFLKTEALRIVSTWSEEKRTSFALLQVSNISKLRVLVDELIDDGKLLEAYLAAESFEEISPDYFKAVREELASHLFIDSKKALNQLLAKLVLQQHTQDEASLVFRMVGESRLQTFFQESKIEGRSVPLILGEKAFTNRDIETLSKTLGALVAWDPENLLEYLFAKLDRDLADYSNEKQSFNNFTPIDTGSFRALSNVSNVDSFFIDRVLKKIEVSSTVKSFSTYKALAQTYQASPSSVGFLIKNLASTNLAVSTAARDLLAPLHNHSLEAIADACKELDKASANLRANLMEIALSASMSNPRHPRRNECPSWYIRNGTNYEKDFTITFYIASEGVTNDFKDDLINIIRTRDPKEIEQHRKVREAAITALENTQETRTALITLMEDEDASIRYEVISNIVRYQVQHLGSPSIVWKKPLIARLADKDAKIRDLALSKLAKYGNLAIDDLTEITNFQNSDDVLRLAKVLRPFCATSNKAMDVVESLTINSDPDVRTETLKCLSSAYGSPNHAAALALFAKFSWESDPSVQTQLITSLLHYQHESTVHAGMIASNHFLTSHKSYGRIYQHTHFNLFSHYEASLKSHVPKERFQAVKFFAANPGESAYVLGQLVNLIADPDPNVATAVSGVKLIKTRVHDIENLLGSGDPRTRISALKTIKAIYSDNEFSAFETRLQILMQHDASEEVKELAAELYWRLHATPKNATYHKLTQPG